jgi:hypothetical protein
VQHDRYAHTRRQSARDSSSQVGRRKRRSQDLLAVHIAKSFAFTLYLIGISPAGRRRPGLPLSPDGRRRKRARLRNRHGRTKRFLLARGGAPGPRRASGDGRRGRGPIDQGLHPSNVLRLSNLAILVRKIGASGGLVKRDGSRIPCNASGPIFKLQRERQRIPVGEVARRSSGRSIGRGRRKLEKEVLGIRGSVRFGRTRRDNFNGGRLRRRSGSGRTSHRPAASSRAAAPTTGGTAVTPAPGGNARDSETRKRTRLLLNDTREARTVGETFVPGIHDGEGALPPGLVTRIALPSGRINKQARRRREKEDTHSSNQLGVYRLRLKPPRPGEGPHTGKAVEPAGKLRKGRPRPTT